MQLLQRLHQRRKEDPVYLKMQLMKLLVEEMAVSVKTVTIQEQCPRRTALFSKPYSSVEVWCLSNAL